MSRINPAEHLRLALVTIALGAILLSLLYSRGIMLYGNDASYYVMTANSLASGHGLQAQTLVPPPEPHRYPMTTWPPGFPSLIAFFVVIGLPGVWAAAAATHLALGAIVFLIGHIAAGAFGWRVGLLAAALSALQPKFWALASNGMSELPLIALALLCALSIGLDRPVRPIVMAACIAGAIYIRCAGVYLIPAVLLASFIPKIRERFSIWESGVVAGASCLALLPLIIRNISISGHLSGTDRPPSDKNVLENLIEAGVAVVSGFVPGSVSEQILGYDIATIVVGITALIALSASFVWVLRNKARLTTTSRNQPFVLLAASAFLYVLVISVLRSISGLDDLNYRLLAPVLPFTITILACGFFCSSSTTLRFSARSAVLAYCAVAALYLFVGPPLAGKPMLLSTARWVQTHVPPGECVVSYDAVVLAPYLNSHRIVLPPSSTDPTGTRDLNELGAWGDNTTCSTVLAIARYERRGSREPGHKLFFSNEPASAMLDSLMLANDRSVVHDTEWLTVISTKGL